MNSLPPATVDHHDPVIPLLAGHPAEPAPGGLSACGVAPIAFGAWGLGGDWGAPLSEHAARRTVERALELGISLFDTAPSYGAGRSESLLGDALAARRNDVILSTKCGPHDDPRQSLYGSLRRLRTDFVDLLQLHEIPAAPDALERMMEAMHQLMDEGLARAIGLCNASAHELTRAAAVAPLTAYQGQLNLVDRDAELWTLPLARARGIGFMAYRPLASGMLTGKYQVPPSFGGADHRARIHWFRGPEFGRRRLVAERLAPVAQENGITLPQLALAWVASRPGVSAVLAGARSPEQVEENARAVAAPLPSSTMAMVDDVVASIYAPRALRGGVRLRRDPDERGEFAVTVESAGVTRRFTVGEREAYVMRSLDGHTTYSEIAARSLSLDGRPLNTAQVVQFVDQLGGMGLLEDIP